MAFAPKIRPYRVLEYSWTVTPPSDLKLGLSAHGLANTFTIMEGPDDLVVQLNDLSEHDLKYIQGVDGITISEIWITSEYVPPVGTPAVVKIYVAWEVQWE